MNSDTGEVRSVAELGKFFNRMRQGDDEAGWFEIDSMPDPNCEVCDGEGWIGYFPNAKVTPCTCVFSNTSRWAKAARKQRDLPKSGKDKGKDLIWHKRLAGGEGGE